VQLRCVENMTAHRIDQGSEQFAGDSDPSGQRGAIQFHTLPRVNLRLAVERAVVRILRNQHMREQPGSSQSACDRPRRSRSFDDCLALAAGELRPHMPYHPEAVRDIIQLLGNVFSEMAKVAAALRAAALLRLVRNDLAWQMLRQRLANRLRTSALG